MTVWRAYYASLECNVVSQCNSMLLSLTLHLRLILNMMTFCVFCCAIFQSPVELQGEYLNKAKISDGGKKQRKNWTSTWVVLDADQLTFHKESKQEALANLVCTCHSVSHLIVFIAINPHPPQFLLPVLHKSSAE